MSEPLPAHGIFELSPKLYLGAYPTPLRVRMMRTLGITHCINVDRDDDVALVKEMDFAEVLFLPIVDGRRIPFEEALPAVDALHRALCEPASRVYVHCFSCCNRSPAVVWFYLVALGMEPVSASDFITACAPQVPSGHADYYGPATIKRWRDHGRRMYHTNPCSVLARRIH